MITARGFNRMGKRSAFYESCEPHHIELMTSHGDVRFCVVYFEVNFDVRVKTSLGNKCLQTALFYE